MHATNNESIDPAEKLQNQLLIRDIAKEYDDPELEYHQWIDQLINEGHRVSFYGKEKRILISEFLKAKLMERAGTEIKSLRWNFWKKHHLSRYKDVKRFIELTTDQLNDILRQLDDTKISDNFIPAISNPRSYLRNFILDLLKEATGDTSATRSPGKHITKDDLEGWPGEIGVKDPNRWNKNEQLEFLGHKDNVRFNKNFKDKYEELMFKNSRKRKYSMIENTQPSLVNPDERDGHKTGNAQSIINSDESDVPYNILTINSREVMSRMISLSTSSWTQYSQQKIYHF